MNKRRYVVCGVSGRAITMWLKPIYEQFSDYAELVGMLDIDPLRFKICNKDLPGTANVPTYMPDEFDKMIEETKPDAVFVVSRDSFHAHYIIKSLEKDLDVITEKPMTTNMEDAVRVREAEKKSKGKVICTFNYRYNPQHRKIRELVLDGKIGRVTHVDLTWYIDIAHGSSYFNRWNRMRENSGSLSIHKASHHFDLVNWWIGSPAPTTVHAFGALNHYGPNGPFNPSKKDGRHCRECTERSKCAYKARWETRASAIKIKDDHLESFDEARGVLYTPEIYRPDMCIFDSEINIHDTIVANVRYANGVLLNYSANFSTPYEGYRLAINGTHGRIEAEEWGGMGSTAFPCPRATEHYVDYYPIFGSRERLWIKPGVGGHGGGDPCILEDVFLGVDPDRKYDILADSRDGLSAISIGDAVYKSIMEEKIIDLTEVMTH
ncbi:MAG: Gfo/Idh/MocA family oxidoreductase [Lentisphaeria bacterium]|nr:Gfo/Idh/MocA family oxidoreductase [Lentisphaeria bacterium]